MMLSEIKNRQNEKKLKKEIESFVSPSLDCHLLLPYRLIERILMMPRNIIKILWIKSKTLNLLVETHQFPRLSSVHKKKKTCCFIIYRLHGTTTLKIDDKI